ncbi:MAG: 50S ribosomal protein L31 [candidate division TM6 bacterium GW2011_GWE2_42_60]|nr:MAG: 50S ribosomal protein L31 [candidate division TM6 bacterium GW2011_GWE2_42_60]HBY06077.1 50S ribosomal protein L31 [Candidatus Dependentiae bacterium]
MKKEKHPKMFEIEAVCTGCSAIFPTISTLPQLRVSLCSKCHPIYTGHHKFVDTAGRIERFQKKYSKK